VYAELATATLQSAAWLVSVRTHVVALAVVAPDTPRVNVPAWVQLTAAFTLPDVGIATDWPVGASVTVAPPPYVAVHAWLAQAVIVTDDGAHTLPAGL
jgi:hypothetical protein